jgi:hypothetical protein
MAHFYGNLKGSRGEATRCGTANSGLSVSARSWAGSVTVELEERDGVTFVHLFARDGSGVGGKLLHSGPLSKLVNASHLFPVQPEV